MVYDRLCTVLRGRRATRHGTHCCVRCPLFTIIGPTAIAIPAARQRSSEEVRAAVPHPLHFEHRHRSRPWPWRRPPLNPSLCPLRLRLLRQYTPICANVFRAIGDSRRRGYDDHLGGVGMANSRCPPLRWRTVQPSRSTCRMNSRTRIRGRMLCQSRSSYTTLAIRRTRVRLLEAAISQVSELAAARYQERVAHGVLQTLNARIINANAAVASRRLEHDEKVQLALQVRSRGSLVIELATIGSAGHASCACSHQRRVADRSAWSSKWPPRPSSCVTVCVGFERMVLGKNAILTKAVGTALGCTRRGDRRPD